MAITLAPVNFPTLQNADLGALMTITAQGAGTFNTDVQKNDGCDAAIITVDVTAISGTTPSLQVLLQGYDGASGKFYTIQQIAAMTTVSTNTILLCEGATVAMTGAGNAFFSGILPARWRISVVITGTAPSVTATIGASVIEG
jgi:hypothetical protein